MIGKTKEGQRAVSMNKWEDAISTDRFIIITFLTEAEKMKFIKENIGINVYYVDAEDVKDFSIKSSSLEEYCSEDEWKILKKKLFISKKEGKPNGKKSTCKEEESCKRES